jgi:hypothetical protein
MIVFAAQTSTIGIAAKWLSATTHKKLFDAPACLVDEVFRVKLKEKQSKTRSKATSSELTMNTKK